MKPGLEAEARRQGFKSVAAFVAHSTRVCGSGRIPYEENPELEALLLEGLSSGEPVVVDDAYWKNLRRRVRAEVRKRKKKRSA